MNSASAADVQRTFAAVDLSTLRNNVHYLRGEYGDICAVVKADAYGHGLVPCARAAVAGGAVAVAVATPAEGQLLRACGLATPIHILSPAEPLSARLCVNQNLTPHVSSLAFLDAFLTAGGNPRDCFLMLDSGMGREGLFLSDTITALNGRSFTGYFGGISTHLASADSADSTSLWQQLEQLSKDISCLKSAELFDDFTVVSINNSAGMLSDRPLHNIVNRVLHRPGALLYGIAPRMDIHCPTQPILVWRARIHLLKAIPQGHAIGYGATYTTRRRSKIATVGVGYADGYPRRTSQESSILVRGCLCPVVGVVSMDQIQVDVTDIPEVNEGDWVTLIGSEGSASITVAMLAAWADVPVQWPTSALSPRVPRRYTGLE